MHSTLQLQRHEGLVFMTMAGNGRPPCVDGPMCEALLDALRTVDTARGDRAVVLQSQGPLFNAGGDLAAIRKDLAELGPGSLERLIARFHAVVMALAALPIPVVAAVQGAAAGGGFSLALACDIVVMADTARLVVGYPSIGAPSDGGLAFQLARRLGSGRAMHVFLATGVLDAKQAEQLGLAQAVCAEAELEAVARGLARRLARHPPTAVAEIKSLVRSAIGDDLSDRLQLELSAFLRCVAAPEFIERVNAFLDRPRAASSER